MTHLIDKDALVVEIEKLKGHLLKGACASQIAMETRCKEEAYDEVLTILDSIQEKHVSNVWHDAKIDPPQAKKKILATNEYGTCKVDYAVNMALYWPKVIKYAYIDDLLNLDNSCQSCKNLQEEPVSEDLEKASKNYALNNTPWDDCKDEIQESFKAGAKWQKENLLKPADGDDLPEIDREVIVLIKYNAQRNIHDEEYPTYRVGFGHRPNPNGWDGKNIDTNEVTHYIPKLYDKGGWNAPDIAYWLDAKLPYEENKFIKEL